VILIDTNIFVDLWTHDPDWAEWSEEALERAAEDGPLGINPIIYSGGGRRAAAVEPHRYRISSSALMPWSKVWPF
jgi:predicted nucleic acid-binding protein